MDIRVVSSLAKVFPNEICGDYEINSLNCLKNEKISFQIVVKSEKATKLSFSSDCADLAFYKVRSVYAGHIAGDEHDDYFLRNAMKGYYPDVLIPAEGEIDVPENDYTSLWCEYTGACEESISVTLKTEDEEKTITLGVKVAETQLDEQTLTCTNWFHSDCLADFYNVSIDYLLGLTDTKKRYPISK